MSVNTTADERLYEIQRSIKDLILELAKWLYDTDVWGRDGYTDEFEERVQEALTLLRSAKKLLG